MNLTGSPLRDDHSIVDLLSHSIANKKLFGSKPWQEDEESFMPIDINLAREIIINVSNQTFPLDAHGWIFILCTDGADEINNATFLLSSCISPKENAHGVGKYYGIVKHENKSMENLLKRHFSLISSKSKLNTKLESVFEIKPEMSLKFINSTSDANPSMSHVNNTSEAILYQKIAIGKNHVLCDQFWSQIQHLNMIKTDIINFKNSSMDGTFLEPPYNYGLADANFENLQGKITQILNDVNSIGEESEAVVDNSLEGVLKRARIRPLLEITDQLWDQLKHTSSYGDLKKIITYIFQVSSRSNIVNIPTNNNRLGELIRELCLQRLAIPYLVGTEPLELLLEIGIEKLMKDYEFILSASKICKLSEMTIGGKAPTKVDNCLSVRKSLAASVDLNQSDKVRKTLLKTNGCLDDNEDEQVGIRNSRFVEREIDASISKLAQIHLVIEHLLLIQNNINMDNDYTAIAKKLLEKPLLPFEDLQNQKYDMFEFPISDRKVTFNILLLHISSCILLLTGVSSR